MKDRCETTADKEEMKKYFIIQIPLLNLLSLTCLKKGQQKLISCVFINSVNNYKEIFKQNIKKYHFYNILTFKQKIIPIIQLCTGTYNKYYQYNSYK